MPTTNPPIQLKDGSWSVSVRFHDSSRRPPRITQTVNAPTKDGALALADQLIQSEARDPASIWGREPRLPGTLTIAEAAEEYIRQNQHKWSSNTRRHNIALINKFVDSCGPHLPASQLEPWHFESTIDPQSSWYTADRTIGRYRTFIRWLNKRHILAETPELRNPVRRHEKIVDYVTRQELDAIKAKIIETARSKKEQKHVNPDQTQLWLLRIIDFAFYTGLRRQELIETRVQDINLKEGTLRVRNSKGYRDDLLPIGSIPQLEKLIRCQLRTLRKQGQDKARQRLFMQNDGSYVSKQFKKYVKLALPPARAERIKFHSIRHGTATYLLQHISLPEVQAWMRHTDHRTTLKYAKVIQKNLQKNVGHAFTAANDQ